MFATRAWSPLHPGLAKAFLPGEQVNDPFPGDFVFTHGTSWTSRMIRFGEKIRYWGPGEKFTRWNHVAIFINKDGDLIEALGEGVQRRNISVYKQIEYHVVHLENVLDINRDYEVEFARACLNDHYGWLTIVSIQFNPFLSRDGSTSELHTTVPIYTCRCRTSGLLVEGLGIVNSVLPLRLRELLAFRRWRQKPRECADSGRPQCCQNVRHVNGLGRPGSGRQVNSSTNRRDADET
jgi:hypothetical protein